MLAVLKFFDMVLKFELPNARVLNFPENSAPSLIGPVLIIGDYVYFDRVHIFYEGHTILTISPRYSMKKNGTVCQFS